MFYYYGAKRKYVKRYPVPKFRVCVEPFAGSAAYAIYHLVHGNLDQVILIEKDPRVVELWNRLMGMTSDEIMALEPPPVKTKTSDFLWMTCAASNALARCKAYSITPRAVDVWQHVRKRMAAELPFIKEGVELIEGDYTDAPDIEATWFIDPPYQVVETEIKTKTAFPRGRGYAPGCCADDIDYPELGNWCQSRKGQVIVCEMEGADWLPFKALYSGHNSLGKRTPEVVWMPPTDPQDTIVSAFKDRIASTLPAFSLYSNGFQWIETNSTLIIYFSRKPPFSIPNFFQCDGRIITLRSEVTSLIR